MVKNIVFLPLFCHSFSISPVTLIKTREIMNTENKIGSLLLAIMNDTATELQHAEFEAWLKEDPRNIAYFEELRNKDTISKRLETYSEYDSMKGWSNFEIKLKSVDRKNKSRLHIRYIISATSAAALIAIFFMLYFNFENRDHAKKLTTMGIVQENATQPTLISGGSVTALNEDVKEIKLNNQLAVKKEGSKITYYNNSDSITSIENTIIVPKMLTYSVELSDGTVVILNANSEMTYKAAFKDEVREVRLKGEAYFEVKKGIHPFIIHTDGADIKVYGTKFNVDCKVQNEIRTTLIAGSVGVTPKNEKELMMQPGELAVVNKTNGKVNVENVDVNKNISWLSSDLSYVGVNVYVLLSDIGSWYGVEFNYDSKLFVNEKVSATINKELNLEKILKSMSKILNVKFIKTATNKYDIEE